MVGQSLGTFYCEVLEPFKNQTKSVNKHTQLTVRHGLTNTIIIFYTSCVFVIVFTLNLVLFLVLLLLILGKHIEMNLNYSSQIVINPFKESFCAKLTNKWILVISLCFQNCQLLSTLSQYHTDLKVHLDLKYTNGLLVDSFENILNKLGNFDRLLS